MDLSRAFGKILISISMKRRNYVQTIKTKYNKTFQIRGPSGGFQRSALRPIFGLALRTPRLIFLAFHAPTYDSAPRSILFSYSHSTLQTTPALRAPPFYHHRSPLQSNLYWFIQYHHNIWDAYKFVHTEEYLCFSVNVSLFFAVALSVCLSVCLCVCVSVCLSVLVCLYLCLGLYYLCISVSLSLWVSWFWVGSLSFCVITDPIWSGRDGLLFSLK